MTYFAEVTVEGRILQQVEVEVPEWGPPDLPETEHEYLVLNDPIIWHKPTPTSELYRVGADAVWVETADLSQLKAWKSDQITQAKIAANADRFTYQGREISVSEDSFREMQSICGTVAMTQAMPANWPGGWKAIDNNYVSIPDVAGWIDFYSTMVQTGLANFARSQVLKAAVQAATTIEDVLAVVW